MGVECISFDGYSLIEFIEKGSTTTQLGSDIGRIESLVLVSIPISLDVN